MQIDGVDDVLDLSKRRGSWRKKEVMKTVLLSTRNLNIRNS